MIITHSSRGHFDDFLAACLVSHITGDTHIKRIKHTAVDETIKNMAKNDVMVDIGGILNPKKRVFDHHQDKTLDAAFIHVAKHFNIKLPKDSLWQYFSDVDTKGPEKARKIHDLRVIEANVINDTVQPILKAWDLVLPEGNIDTELFIKIGNYLNEKNFNLNLPELTGIKNIVEEVYAVQFSKAEKQIAKDKKQKEEVIKSLKYTKIGDYPVAINKSSLYLSHADTGTSVILTINKRTGNPCFIVDTEVLHVNEILNLLNNPNTVFVHANGFLAVIDDTWDNVNMLLNKKSQ